MRKEKLPFTGEFIRKQEKTSWLLRGLDMGYRGESPHMFIRHPHRLAAEPRGAQAATRPVGNTSAEPGTRPILPAPVLRRNFQSTQGVFGRNLSIRFGAFCFEDCSIFFA